MSASARVPGRLPPTARLLGTLAMLVAIAGLPPAHAPWLWVPTLLWIAIFVLAGAPWRPLLRRLLWLSPLIAGTALGAALSGHGPDWRLLAWRSGLSLATVLLLGATTPFADLLDALRRLRVPSLLISVLALMHRYLAVIGDESARMQRARTARTLTRSRPLAWRNAASVVGVLFVRSTERAERVYAAMCARGWRT